MNKIIARISEGLGNQLFMYAHAYALSKKINYQLYLDKISAYQKLKNKSFLIDRFNLPIKFANDDEIQDTYVKYIFHKINKKIDFFRNRKKFLIEYKNKDKITSFIDHKHSKFDNTLFVEGYFESEKYFKPYRKEIINYLSIKNIDLNSLFLDPKIIHKNNSISIAVRKNRFSEQRKSFNFLEKSRKFEKSTLDYILRSISYFRNKIIDPHFYIFSDDPTDLNDFFSSYKDCTVVIHKNDKIFNDFYLSSLCKHFIVGPTTFHWWTAYVSKNTNKICVRPPNELKFSSNIDIFPKDWIRI